MGDRKSGELAGSNNQSRDSESVISNDPSLTALEPQRVEVKIHGQSYYIIGGEDPARVDRIARYVNDKMNEIAQYSRGTTTLKLAILAALNISDELFQLRDQSEFFALKGEKMLSLLSEVIED